MRTPPTQTRWFAWLAWGTATALYVIAVMHRTSLIALGPTAQQHFEVGATGLSLFAVLQVVVYAAMQIPVGAVLDRFGVASTLIWGGTIMAVGQLVMAFAESVPMAILARMLVGAGDACMFISVIRMLPDWFAAPKLPLMGQLTSMVGYCGQFVALFPLPLAVHRFGWTIGFAACAALGGLVVLLGVFVLRDTPTSASMWQRLRGRGHVNLRRSSPPLRAVGGLLRIPGIRLSFWMHFISPMAMFVFQMLWGTPFLIGGLGLSAQQASIVLSTMVVSGAVSGLILGKATSTFAHRRVEITLGMVIASILSWTLIWFWPGTPPFWVAIPMLVLVAAGIATSMIAFEEARAHAPTNMQGLATGLVNVGGFTATLLAVFLVGISLDLLGAGSPETYRIDAFKIAFATHVPLWALGITMILIEQKKTRLAGRTQRGRQVASA